MTAQVKQQQPESPGRSKPEPEMSGKTPQRPETSGKTSPGAMPENPANVDREHDPAGIDPRTDRTKQR